jgi:hypothetical protein
MEDETTTAASATTTDGDKTATTSTDQTTTATGSQTATDTTGSDNLDTSKTTDTTSAGGDKSTDEGDKGSPAPKFDTDLDEWAEKTKRPVPTTDRERELYQEIRNSQRDFSRSKQAKDATQSVDKAITAIKPADNKGEDDERDPVEIRQDALEETLAEERSLRVRSEYFSEKSVDQKTADVMGEILKEKVDRAATPEAKQQAFKYWTHPDQLEDWHALANARLATVKDTTVIEQEAARKERERIAKESQANGGTRSATTTQTASPKGYSRSEYLKSDD